MLASLEMIEGAAAFASLEMIEGAAAFASHDRGIPYELR